jgi:plasmid stability protein
MGSLLIRNIDDRLKARLKSRAARRGHSVEQEVRDILAHALATDRADAKGLGTAIRELFAPLGGVELELPAREPAREPPDFSKR